MVLTMFLVIVLGILDLGIAVYYYHLLGETARQGARMAIVHGSLSQSPWSTSASVASALQSWTDGVGLKTATVSADWPNGTNNFGDLVHVQVTMSYQPMTTYVFGKSFALDGESTMPIAH